MTKAFLAMMQNAETIEENIDNIDVINFFRNLWQTIERKIKT